MEDADIPMTISLPLAIFEKTYQQPQIDIHQAVEMCMAHLWSLTTTATIRTKVEDFLTTEDPLDKITQYSLSLDEAGALVYYTLDCSKFGEDAENNLFINLNRRLATRKLEDEWKPFTFFLIKALKKIPNMKGRVFRGIDKPLLQISNLYKEGNLIIWVAFTSTSTNCKISKKFSKRDTGTWMILEVTEGKDLQGFSIFREREILLLPNTNVRVKEIMSNQLKEVAEIPQNIDVIYLTQEPTPEKDCFEFDIVQSDTSFDICLELYQYDPIWKQMFDDEQKNILANIGLSPLYVTIIHVGSTSIIDMISKPYVDIAISFHFVPEIIGDLVKLGYKPLYELLPKDHIINYGTMFREVSKKGSFRGYFIHLSGIVDIEALQNFKRKLNNNEKLRNEYKLLKTQLSLSEKNFTNYTIGKSNFVLGVVGYLYEYCSVSCLIDLVWKEDYDTLKCLFEKNPMLATFMRVLDCYASILVVLFTRKTPNSLKTAKLLLKYGCMFYLNSCAHFIDGKTKKPIPDKELKGKISLFIEGKQELDVCHPCPSTISIDQQYTRWYHDPSDCNDCFMKGHYNLH